MVFDLFAILWAPFLMCLVLTGIHAYLGVHVLAREVVFVDIAMAQIAALGATAAFLQGYEIEQWESYAYSLAATLLGALVLSITRSRRRNVSQEAVIGIVYASFGVVVASSVRIAGVLLVFSYLIVPALAGVMLGGTVAARLLIGWAFGTVVSVIGMVASAALDLPTGATVVCAFGVTLIAFWIATRVSRRLAALGAGPPAPAGHPRR